MGRHPQSGPIQYHRVPLDAVRAYLPDSHGDEQVNAAEWGSRTCFGDDAELSNVPFDAAQILPGQQSAWPPQIHAHLARGDRQPSTVAMWSCL
jgi:hypothetical protein